MLKKILNEVKEGAVALLLWACLIGGTLAAWTAAIEKLPCPC